MLKVEADHKIKSGTGEITEIFSSIQGEGICVGEKHLFVRFRSCNIACNFCDEFAKTRYQELSTDGIIDQLKRLEQDSGPHESVSLTGGEPLIYLPFLKGLMAELKQEGFRTYLETNGILPRALREVLDLSDMIAMDIKLPSVTKERSFFAEHEEFLKIAAQRTVFVKMVVSKEASISEFLTAVNLMARVDRNIPLILQPKTNLSDQSLEPGIVNMLSSWVSIARRVLTCVRVIPQTHKWMKVL